MLLVVMFRHDGEPYAQRHINDEHTTMTFCGLRIPQVVYDTPAVYINSGPVTCEHCIYEFNEGRREGYRETDIGE